MSIRRIITLLLSAQVAILMAHVGLGHGVGVMTLLMLEGFDHVGAGANIYLKPNWSGGSGSTGAGRFGGLCSIIVAGATSRSVFYSFGTPVTTVIIGFAYLYSGGGTLTFMNLQTVASGTVASFNLDATGHILAKNSGGTTIGTGTTVINSGAWNYIEIKLFVNAGTPASGTVEVHVNGAVDIASTAGNFGSTGVSKFGISSNNSGQDHRWDDVYACDTVGAVTNTFLGDVRVATVYGTSDGAHTQWTPTGGGAHYTQVNEVTPDGDTTYVSDNTPGDLDSYGFGDIDGGATVYGVQVNLYARKDDAATRQIAPVIRQASTDYVGNTQTLNTSYAFYNQLYEQDPTVANWTPVNVNADEFGVKEIA
jgi:hypothetical protein